MESMMNRTLIAVGAAALVIAGAGAANAQGYRYGSGVDARQDRQSARIAAGIRNGSLTRREGAALRAEQSRIAAFERRARADGHLSMYERARMRMMQNQASRHIMAERHDAQTRRPWWRRTWWR
jgi:hypothetical protein